MALDLSTAKAGSFGQTRLGLKEDIPEIFKLLEGVSYNAFFDNMKHWPFIVHERNGIKWCGFTDYVEEGNYASIHIVGKDKPFELVKQCRIALKMFFDLLQVRTIRAIVNENFRGPQTLVKRLGFRFEGTLYDYAKVNNKWTNFKLYSINEELL